MAAVNMFALLDDLDREEEVEDISEALTTEKKNREKEEMAPQVEEGKEERRKIPTWVPLRFEYPRIGERPRWNNRQQNSQFGANPDRQNSNNNYNDGRRRNNRANTDRRAQQNIGGDEQVQVSNDGEEGGTDIVSEILSDDQNVPQQAVDASENMSTDKKDLIADAVEAENKTTNVAEGDINVPATPEGQEESNEKKISKKKSKNKKFDAAHTRSDDKKEENPVNLMTLAEYEQFQREKKVAELARKSEWRKVTLDKDFESMQLVGKRAEDSKPIIVAEQTLKKDTQRKEDKASKTITAEFMRKPFIRKPRFERFGQDGNGQEGNKPNNAPEQGAVHQAPNGAPQSEGEQPRNNEGDQSNGVRRGPHEGDKPQGVLRHNGGGINRTDRQRGGHRRSGGPRFHGEGQRQSNGARADEGEWQSKGDKPQGVERHNGDGISRTDRQRGGHRRNGGPRFQGEGQRQSNGANADEGEWQRVGERRSGSLHHQRRGHANRGQNGSMRRNFQGERRNGSGQLEGQVQNGGWRSNGGPRNQGERYNHGGRPNGGDRRDGGNVNLNVNGRQSGGQGEALNPSWTGEDRRSDASANPGESSTSIASNGHRTRNTTPHFNRPPTGPPRVEDPNQFPALGATPKRN
ncbi:hypothetical protein Tsubulata_023943 [Turnera subulata]|uniref:Hyaluronan/mRNA-binding protein domain-containing protein n=1 Tax=Turnera subulata TaxID=218843 RepID=A0A9Q0FWL0_9ROSI|nr:hypothetical protein Tsubulata_023943 [Turnera subulata]